MPITVSDISQTIESIAPQQLQEKYDNTGLQVGDAQMQVSGVMLCLDVTSEIIDEAIARGCNMIVSHHPLLFGGIRRITSSDERGRLVIRAVSEGIAIYAAHTNLDKASGGVSYEMAHSLGIQDIEVLSPDSNNPHIGLGVIGFIKPKPTLSFLRQVKETFGVECLRYSQHLPSLTVRKVALCGGAGASLIGDAVAHGADVIVTGDVKYHDFTTWAGKIMIADIGHYESELCSKKIFARLIKERYPDLPTYLSEVEVSPINFL